jgi:fructokinase
MSVVVLGEALIDLVGDQDDTQRFTAHAGGSPANVAVALARLGTPVRFAGRLAGDGFGRLLREHLERNGVDLALAITAAEPTSLAVVTVGRDGAPEYAFYVHGTADWQWSARELPHDLPGDVAAIHTGSLALAMPPGGAVLEEWLAAQHGRRTISVDPNVRPALVGPRDAYRRRLERWVGISDIVKVSVEDLGWVYPGADPLEVAAGWRHAGGPALVVVTLGADGAAACVDGQVIRRPAPPVDVVDTVGAGDAFSGALLDWLGRRDLLDRDALQQLSVDDAVAAVDFACMVAAETCSYPGADPPYRDELIPRTPAAAASTTSPARPIARRIPAGEAR